MSDAKKGPAHGRDPEENASESAAEVTARQVSDAEARADAGLHMPINVSPGDPPAPTAESLGIKNRGS